MSSKNLTRVLKTDISVGNVRDHLTQLLVALGVDIKDNEDVSSMTLGLGTKRFELDGTGRDVIPLTVYLKKHREVKVTHYNGQ